ncbi:MAG TPA: lipase family protein [Ignavibacteria bacterium]|nr:lipase family protein [Ignavibacteria bacterium]
MKFAFLIILLVYSISVYSQSKLKPGFDPEEYRTLLEITERTVDSSQYTQDIPYPFSCQRVFRSDSVGLNNRWDLWIRDDSVAIISIRGTIMRPDSWSENFYASMSPATGMLNLGNNKLFSYKLAKSNRASVHSGWLIGLAYIGPSIVEKINEYYTKGFKEYIILGHSQGGALTYFVTAYLNYLDFGTIPSDVKFKTYSSAPPKPGNLFFSYDYDFMTRGGWSIRVYNSEDWVPQTPISVQTLNDFATINPYSDRDSMVKNMNLLDKIIFGYITSKVKNSLDGSKDILKTYMGKDIFKASISKFLPKLTEPVMADDMYYYPCGVPVVLLASDDYFEYMKTHPQPSYLFENHLMEPYYYLLNKIYFEK